jgi:hypothetical protein
MVLASPDPLDPRGLEYAADGIGGYSEGVSDVIDLKNMTKAYSSVTQFYDHAGQF